MKVKNNETRVHVLGGSGDAGVRLIPGVNEVDDEAWKKATEKPGPALKHLLDKKVLEVVGESEPTGAAKPATTSQDLSGYDVAKAKDIIADTFDRDTLTKWRRAEKRKEVQTMLDDQLELTKPEKK